VATGTTIEKAIKAYKIKHYGEASAMFRKLAKKNDPDALFYLGLFHYEGHGVDRDYDKAHSYFLKAREELHKDAFAYLGLCHEHGHGTDIDRDKAYHLYETAAEHGSEPGLLHQARCLEKGIGTKKNKAKALKCYVRLAKMDNAYAMYRIGKAYLTGDGIRKSIESAHEWLNKALVNGSVDAMNYLRYIHVNNDRDARSSEDILAMGKEWYEKEAYEKAHIYFEIAANEDLPEALMYLSDMYRHGKGVKQDKQKSIACLQEAKEHLPEAWMTLAQRFRDGDGVASSYVKAYECYEHALEQGVEGAREQLEQLRGYRRE
jgi:hypothetical protein